MEKNTLIIFIAILCRHTGDDLISSEKVSGTIGYILSKN